MELKAGVQVIHPLFGTGTVRAVSGSGREARITVDFAGSVGQKKLMAGVANLQVVGARSEGDAPPRASEAAWYESLEALCRSRSGRRPPTDKVIAAMRNEISRQEFWVQIRERLRGSGHMPRALDDLQGRVALSLRGALDVRIVVKHPELVRSADAVLSGAVFDLLAQRCLIDFEVTRSSVGVEVQGELPDADVVTISDAAPEGLPDRAPLRRPKPVPPKGTIRARGKRHDDY